MSAAATRAQLLGGLMTPSDAYGWGSVIRLVGGVLLSLALAAVLAAAWTPWAGWLAAPLVGLRIYKLTQVLHDCIHRTLFRRAETNRRVGLAVGVMTGIDFAAFRRLHLRHHRIYGRAGDPQGGDYLGLAGARRHRVLAHLLRPLVGGAAGTMLILAAEQRRMPRRGRIGFLIGAAAWQGLLVLAVTCGGAFPELAPLPLVAAFTFGLFFSQARGFAEHVVDDGGQAQGFVRSHRASVWDRLLLYDLNFHRHAEHHRFPQVPSVHLPELSRRLGVEATTGATMLATIHRRIAQSPCPILSRLNGALS